MKEYNITVLSGNDSAALLHTYPKSFRITCGGVETVYTAEDVKAVTVKTMDTGPIIEDLYAEAHIGDKIYIIPSEFKQYTNTVINVLGDIVDMDFELSIEASTCHSNKTFVLYQKKDVAAETEDNDEKLTAILEALLKANREARQSSELMGFIFAILSFCPMYLMFGKGEHKDQLVNLASISDDMIPIYTLDKCPNGDQFEKRLMSAKDYIRMLAADNCKAMVNYGSDTHFLIGSETISSILMPIIVLREEAASVPGSEHAKGEGEIPEKGMPYAAPAPNIPREPTEADKIAKLEKEQKIIRITGIILLVVGYILTMTLFAVNELFIAPCGLMAATGLVLTARSFFHSRYAVLKTSSAHPSARSLARTPPAQLRHRQAPDRSYGTSSAPKPPQNAAAPAPKTQDDPLDRLMTSQLVALYRKHINEKSSDKYLKNYLSRLEGLGIGKDEAFRLFEFEKAVVEKFNKPYLLDPNFTENRLFTLTDKFFGSYPQEKSDILKERFLTISEICKLVDEADWHFYNSHESAASDEVWHEICEWRLRGAGGEFAIEYFGMIAEVSGVSEKSIALLTNEQGRHLNKFRWSTG